MINHILCQEMTMVNFFMQITIILIAYSRVLYHSYIKTMELCPYITYYIVFIIVVSCLWCLIDACLSIGIDCIYGYSMYCLLTQFIFTSIVAAFIRLLNICIHYIVIEFNECDCIWYYKLICCDGLSSNHSTMIYFLVRSSKSVID